MLDVIVLIAMAVTAVAFAAGLIYQAGLPFVPVLIGAAALFLVMVTSFLSMGRGARGGGGAGADRLAELEEALEIIDGDLQRLDRVEDGLSRLDGLTETVERLDQAVAGGAVGEGAADLEGVYSRIEAMRAEIKAENQNHRDKIAGDLGTLDSLIKRITGDIAAASGAGAAAAAFTSREEPEAAATVEIEEVVEIESEPEPLAAFELTPEPEPEPSKPAPLWGLKDETAADSEDGAEPELELETAAVIEEDIETVALEEEPAPAEMLAVDEDAAEASAPEPEGALPTSALLDDDEEAAEEKMLVVLREGISEGRVDLYLQPTVTLPDRKVRYFEALTRIRKKDDEIVLPGEYMAVAKRSGLMPLVDNVLLVRSVQVLRRLGQDNRIKGVFGNVSMHSLLDPDYYPELIEFMEENSGLSENLVFEISQAEMGGLTQSELACLDTLGALGYTFCLDNVADMEADFSALSDRYFRHVKVSAASFLGGPTRKATDLKRQLDSLGMQLIIEKVENEGDVAELLDHGVELAQGDLFGEPAPMNTALSKELEDAGAS